MKIDFQNPMNMGMEMFFKNVYEYGYSSIRLVSASYPFLIPLKG